MGIFPKKPHSEILVCEIFFRLPQTRRQVSAYAKMHLGLYASYALHVLDALDPPIVTRHTSSLCLTSLLVGLHDILWTALKDLLM